jgi:hypothetical protein
MSSKNLLTTVGELIDAIVELYLKTVIAPFLHFHEIFYSSLNRALRQLLDDHKHHIPDWFTANLITYVRTVVVVPTLVLLSWNHAVLPALLVLAVDFGDFLDGVVARYWVDVKKERAEAAASDKDKKNDPALRTPSPTNSDDESFGTYRPWIVHDRSDPRYSLAHDAAAHVHSVKHSVLSLSSFQKSSRRDRPTRYHPGYACTATVPTEALWMPSVTRLLSFLAGFRSST